MSRYSIPPLVTREEERDCLLAPSGVGGDVLADGVDDGRVTVKEVGRLDSVDGDGVSLTILVHSDRLSPPAQDFEGALVGLLQGLLHSVNPDEHVCAIVQILADKSLGGRRARLDRLQTLHEVREVGSKASRQRVKQSTQVRRYR